MKHKNSKKLPFLYSLLLTCLIFSGIGFWGRNTIYSDLSVHPLKIPFLALVFEGMGEGNYPWTSETQQVLANQDNKDSQDSKDSQEDPGTAGADSTDKTPASIDDNNKNSTDSGSKPKPDTKEKDPGKETANAKNTTYSFQTVKESYFDDALFIGDSRTVGLYDYSGWDKPTYIADVGLTIYDVFDKKIAGAEGDKVTLEKALEAVPYGKIYIMLGINELGRGTTETFTKEYKKVIKRIHRLQPDAIIFIEGIMNVSKEKSDKDPIFNNINIKDRNDSIKKLADNKNFFYIDVNEAITDKTGGIPAEYTFDNIHLKAAYYKIWTDFLLKHGIVKNTGQDTGGK